MITEYINRMFTPVKERPSATDIRAKLAAIPDRVCLHCGRTVTAKHPKQGLCQIVDLEGSSHEKATH